MSSRIAGLRALLTMGLASPPAFADFGPPPVPANAQFPYVTCHEIGGRELTSHDGRSGLGLKNVQFNCWSPDYEAAWECRRAIMQYLTPSGQRGYRGAAGDQVIADTVFDLDREFYDGERELHQLICSFDIWWET